MNKLLLIMGCFALIAIASPLINSITGDNVVNYDLECPKGVEIDYYYSPVCHACQDTTPMIDELISQGCPINKINVKEEYDLALTNNIQYTPTLIVNGNRLVGRFTFEEVKNLITN